MTMISVLMGTYNEKKEYVTEAIESILNQTEAEFEFIICDDASEQEFYHWLKEYCKKDKRIILLRNEENIGLAATLNRCLKHSKGQYIARMDADDISLSNRFELQKTFLEGHPEIALVGSNVWLIDKEHTWGMRKVPLQPSPKDFLFGNPFVHPAVMMRRNVLEELRGYSEEAFALRTEDYELFMRVYAAGYMAQNLQTPVLKYREELDSFQKRKYRYRINEAKVRYRGFKQMGLLNGNMRYVIKPLLVGLIPVKLMRKLRKKRFGAES